MVLRMRKRVKGRNALFGKLPRMVLNCIDCYPST